ncbi:hypothetical protein BSKO_00498 [Bryopsis sp. KO-2023]|nr:hypothetical protein BSKO_00498 [Bryopsis sp. KO-2023]
MPPTVKRLASAISCHAWNGDRTSLALSPHSAHIHIYSIVSDDEWKRVDVLKGHGQLVSGLDWAPLSDLLVSVSHDRNSFVWRLDEGTWKPLVVLTRLNRAALCVKWSPSEQKFAIGSGSSAACVCYYEVDNDWWVAKRIKKHSSSVVSVSWHPSNGFLATASTDRKCRIFTATLLGIDVCEEDSQHSFGHLLFEVDIDSGWPLAIVWSVDGSQLAVSTQGGCVVIYAAFECRVEGGLTAKSVDTIVTQQLPFTSLLFLSDGILAGAGYDAHPFLISNETGQWKVDRIIEEKTHSLEKTTSGGFAAALEAFQSALHGSSPRLEHDGDDFCHHLDCIVELAPLQTNSAGHSTRFSTAGLDGRIVVWDAAVSCLSDTMGNINIS